MNLFAIFQFIFVMTITAVWLALVCFSAVNYYDPAYQQMFEFLWSGDVKAIITLIWGVYLGQRASDYVYVRSLRRLFKDEK